jgi:hypothetical protein
MQQKPQIDQSKSSHLFNSNQLQMACQYGESDKIIDILQRNPSLDPDVTDNTTGKTPLNFLVLRNGSLESISALLAANADPLKSCGSIGLNAIDRALLFKRRAILEMLLTDCNLHGRVIKVHPNILQPGNKIDAKLQQEVINAQLIGQILSNIRPYAESPNMPFSYGFMVMCDPRFAGADLNSLNHVQVLPQTSSIGILNRLINAVRRIFS